ncbi:hypothetical protein [Streptococcus salivarius]
MKKYSSGLLVFFKCFFSGLCNFFIRIFRFIAYPQYSLFGIEVIFFIVLIWYSIKLALPTFNLCFLIVGLIVAIIKFNCQRGINYGGISEQLNDTEGRGEELKNSIPKILKKYHYYFSFLAIILICNNILSIGDALINDLGIIFALILFVSELFLNIFAFSPYLFILFIFGLPTVVNSIGKESAFLNWTFLTFVLATFIGSNFFDKSLFENRVSKETMEKLTNGNLILRKISYFIGVIFLFIGILSSEFVLNSTSYYLFVHSIKSTIGSSSYMSFIVKGITFFLVFLIYLGTEKKIVYVIFRFYYRDMELEFPSKLVEVYMDKKIWRIGEKNILPFHLKNLKRISLDTYQIEKDKNRYYVNQKSEIPNKIKGSYKNDGRHILGVVDFWTWFSILIMIAILLFIFLQDKKVSVENGIYYNYGKSDNTDISDAIEISDDTIIYKGKAETFDTRKQSFSMGEIKKNDSDSITVKFYKNGEEASYTKLNTSGIPYELKEKYSGYFNEPGWDKSIFSSGSSTLIFNKNENKITKIESQTKSFVVIPEDKLDGKAKDFFKKHKREYKSNYFIFTLNTKYDKNSSNIYVAILSDGGKEIKINRLDSSTKDDNYFDHFTGKAE